MQLENGNRINSDLESREKSYIQRLSDLEQQLQQEREKNETLLPLQDRNHDVNSLIRNIEELTSQQDRLRMVLSQKVIFHKKMFIKKLTNRRSIGKYVFRKKKSKC